MKPAAASRMTERQTLCGSDTHRF